MATSPPSPRCRRKAPEIKPEQLKKTADFRLIGKDVMRVELPRKVNGSATYGIDVQVPGMLYGTVLRAPVEGSVPDKIDDAKAKAVPGVTAVIRLPHGVGVVAANRVGCILSAPGADRRPSPGAEPASPGVSTATRGSTPSPPMRGILRGQRATGAHKATPGALSRTRPAWSRASIAATTPITRRWSR